MEEKSPGKSNTASNNYISLLFSNSGGEGGIRTPGRGFSPYNGLANRRIQPLCHLTAANVLQHCNLLPHLVTVPPSVAAFWCTAVNPILETKPESYSSPRAEPAPFLPFRAIDGGGLLIHPDLFAQTDLRLFCLRYELFSCTKPSHLQSIVQQSRHESP